EQRRLYYKDSSAVDNDDTGDKKSFGDSGLQVTSSTNITGSLSFNSTTYYLGNNVPAGIGDQLKDQTRRPAQVAAVEQTRTITAVSENATQPADFRLDEARPNPFAPREGSVQISFDLGRTNVKPGLRIFNLLGQEIARFDAADLLRSQTVLWNGRDRSSRLVPAGIYFYELTVGRQRAVKKLILLR
ncbi:MAG: T9SS type A sorting domain-containing protein, partial [bacterium]